MHRSRIPWAAVAALLVVGCVAPQQRLYAWGKYDSALYTHYKKPAERTQWVTNLKTIIAEAEQAGAKVPPGMYAEFGYALFEEGQRDGAVTYFEKEKALWPESRVFMDKMILNAQRQPVVVPASTGEATAAEGGGK